MKARSMPHQYEPLMTPPGWKDEERRFAVRLTALLDTLFQKTGQMDVRIRKLEALQKGEKSSE